MHDQGKIKEALSAEEQAAREKEYEITGNLYRSLHTMLRQHVYTPEALQFNSELLLRVPEDYTMYNYRREILHALWTSTESADGAATSASARTQGLVEELHLNSKVLRKNFKIYAAFVHRHWVFEQLAALAEEEVRGVEKEQHSVQGATSSSTADSGASSDSASPAAAPSPVAHTPALEVLVKALEKERRECEQLLQLDERNFHAWNYRRWVVGEWRQAQRLGQRLTTAVLTHKRKTEADAEDTMCNPALLSPSAPASALFTQEEEAEVAYTKAKIYRNFSNYSAWHQRGLTVQAALRRFDAQRQTVALVASDAFFDELWRLVREDVDMLIKAVYCDPNDQAAWFYAPFVLQVFSRYDEALLAAYARSARLSAASDTAQGEAAEEEERDYAGLLARCHGNVMDALVEAVVELQVEETRLQDTDVYFPQYFLLSLLAQLKQDTAKAENTATTTSGGRGISKRQQYEKLIAHRVYGLKGETETNATADAVREIGPICVRHLHAHLTATDPMRAGLYDSLLQQAL